VRVGPCVLAVTAIGAAIAAACTSKTISSVDPFPGIPPTAVGGVPSEDPSAAKPQPPERCPATAPKDDESCTGQAAACDYGNDLRDTCNLHAYCSGSVWSVSAVPTCEVNCPKTRGEVVPGTNCDDATMACSWPEGTCACVAPKTDGGISDAGGSTDGGTTLKKGTWACAPPPSKGTCPLTVPKSGSACVKQTICDYGTCELRRDLTFACTGRVWSKTTPEEACDP
jgi:hypothetical protein